LFGVKGFKFSNLFRAFVDSFPNDEEKKALDLGCGYGQKSLFLASTGWLVTALDIDAKKLAFLKKRAEEYNLDICIAKGSMNDLQFQDNVFDAVICLSTIHHQKYSGIENTLAEIHRVLKPRGKVFFDILSINDPSYETGENIEKGTKTGGREGEENIPHHYSTKKELEELLADYSDAKINENKFSYEYDHGNYICVLFEVIAVK
jgi:ubiquinone/menaquinone biosynthesis C-methylase UbiE